MATGRTGSGATSGTPMERYKVLSIQAATLRRRWSGGSVLDEPAFDGPTQPAVIIADHMGVPNPMKPWDHFRISRGRAHTGRATTPAETAGTRIGHPHRVAAGLLALYQFTLQKMGIRRGGRVQCDLSPPYTVHGCKKSYIRAIDVGSFLIELFAAENTGTMNQERSAPMKRRFWCKLLKGLVSCDNCRDEGTDPGTRSVQGTAF